MPLEFPNYAIIAYNCGGRYAHNYTCAAMATESPLHLGCCNAIPRTCDTEYEKRLVVISVGQATITDFSHIS